MLNAWMSKQFISYMAIFLTFVSWAIHSEVLSAPIERTKSEFLALAADDINSQQRTIQTEMDVIKEKAGVAPLFVQIPSLMPFIDFDFWYIDRDLRWAPPKNSKLPAVKVPKGFTCDLASVPNFLWGALPPTGRYAYAAIVHDYLYWSQTTTREVADEILAVAMRDAGTDEATIKEFKLAVRVFGSGPWSANKEAKARGEKRILSVFPPNKLISWKDWKAKAGVFKD